MSLLRDGRIATIDGLRGIAILLVVWFHVWQITWQAAVVPGINLSLQPLAETGFFGVALFFFISGFVLTMPFVHARLGDRPAPSWRHFFGRRFMKIVPSYVLCIAVMIAAGYQTYPNFANAVRDVVLHLLFVHIWFAQTYGTINGVLWSLGVEIQFYALFPLIVYAFVRRPLMLTLGLFALANAYRLWCLASDHYYLGQRLAQLPAYIDFFAAGMLGAWLCTYVALRRPSLAARSSVFSVLMLAGVAAFVAIANVCYAERFTPEWPHHWDLAWRSALAIACLATGVGAVFAARPLQWALANPVLLFLAAISYNLYLFHTGVAHALLTAHVPPMATADPHEDRTWMWQYWLVAIPAMVAAATIVTYGFERPLLRWRKRLERRGALADSSHTAVAAPVVSGPAR